MAYEFNPHDIDSSAAEVFRELHKMVNIMGDGKAINDLVHLIHGDHRTLQQSVMRDLVMPLLYMWQVDAAAGRFDARNEGTVMAAEVMVNCFETNRIGLPLI